MKAKNGQVNEELMVIKLFRGNYARDLLPSWIAQNSRYNQGPRTKQEEKHIFPERGKGIP